MRRFYLIRGGNPVAAVVEFGPFFGPDKAVVCWFGDHSCVSTFEHLSDVKRVHVHEGDELRPVGAAKCSDCRFWREVSSDEELGQCMQTASSSYPDDECPRFTPGGEP